MIKKLNAPFLNPEEVEGVFLIVLSKTQELISGEHSSRFVGVSGFDFSSIREKQPDDPSKRIDWAKSTFTGFNPLMVREMVEERTVEVLIVADASLSTRFGLNGITIGHGIARVIATVGFSAAIIQDPVAQLVFTDDRSSFESFGMGKNHVLYLLDLYQDHDRLSRDFLLKNLSETVSGEIRRTSLVVFISDFLSPETVNACKGLADLASVNDIVVLMVDASFAFELPRTSSSWVGCYDAESGRHKIFSARELKRLRHKVFAYQEEAAADIEKMGLEVLRVSPESKQFHDDILHFFLDRRLQGSRIRN